MKPSELDEIERLLMSRKYHGENGGLIATLIAEIRRLQQPVDLEACVRALHRAARYHAFDSIHVDGDSVKMTRAVLTAANIPFKE